MSPSVRVGLMLHIGLTTEDRFLFFFRVDNLGLASFSCACRNLELGVPINYQPLPSMGGSHSIAPLTKISTHMEHTLKIYQEGIVTLNNCVNINPLFVHPDVNIFLNRVSLYHFFLSASVHSFHCSVGNRMENTRHQRNRWAQKQKLCPPLKNPR